MERLVPRSQRPSDKWPATGCAAHSRGGLHLEDALVGGSINTLLRNSDRVRVACQAKLVNVIVPLVTSRTTVLRQSIYDPCGWALRDARAVGRLDARVESETYPISAAGLQADFARNDRVPFVDIATHDAAAKQLCALMLNRDVDGERRRDRTRSRRSSPTDGRACGGRVTARHRTEGV